MNVLVLRNPGAGRAAAGWPLLRDEMERTLPAAPRVCDDLRAWPAAVEELGRSGPGLVLAAGGDGTVHRAVNILLALPEEARANLCLGVAGLGSSNDFLKSPPGAGRVGGVPVRWRPGDAVVQNVLRVEYRDGAGAVRVEYAATSCNVGIVAAGNDRFNRGRGVIGACRRLGASAGVLAATVSAAFRRPAVSLLLTLDGRELFAGRIELAAAFVNPHFAGRLRFPSLANPGSPAMGVAVLPEAGVCRRAALLATTARRGLPSPPALCGEGQECEMVPDRPTLLEMDGEVATAARIRVRLLRGALRVCR